MSGEPRIVPLAEQDIEPCAALMATSEPWTRYGIDAAAAQALWTQALETGATVAVAREGQATRGFAWYIARGAFGLRGFLQLPGVSRAARGRGGGAALPAHTRAGA